MVMTEKNEKKINDLQDWNYKCQWTEKGHVKDILLDEKAQNKIGNIMQPTYKLFLKNLKALTVHWHKLLLQKI